MIFLGIHGGVSNLPFLAKVHVHVRYISSLLAGVTPSEGDKVRHSTLASENLTNNQP